MPTNHAAMFVEFELGADFWIFEFVKFGILDRDEGIFGEDILNLAGQKLRPSEQTGIVKTNDIDRLIGAIVQFEQRAAGIERNGVFDARYAAHLVENVIGQRNGVGDGLDRRVHHPNRGPDIDDGRRRTGEYPRKKGRHLNHQEHGEGDPDQKRRKLRPVIDQKLVGDPQDSRHSGKDMRRPCHF